MLLTHNRRSGFTLLELIILIALLAIMAAGLFALYKRMERAISRIPTTSQRLTNELYNAESDVRFTSLPPLTWNEPPLPAATNWGMKIESSTNLRDWTVVFDEKLDAFGAYTNWNMPVDMSKPHEFFRVITYHD